MPTQEPYSQEEVLTMVDEEQAYDFAFAANLTQFEPIARKPEKFKQLGLFGKNVVRPSLVAVASHTKNSGTTEVTSHKRKFPDAKPHAKKKRKTAPSEFLVPPTEDCKESLALAISLRLADVRAFMNTKFNKK